MTIINTNHFKNLQCPCCKQRLLQFNLNSSFLKCESCSISYPILNKIPVLINEEESIFTHKDFLETKNLFFDISKWGKFKSSIAKLIPNIGTSNSKVNFSFITKLLESSTGYKPKVLILGGSIIGTGMEEFLNTKNLEFIESDVSFGPRTQIVLDAHSIPFEDGVFDCVVAQAVLEHVLDPYKCVGEIHRVLKQGGIVYSEIPFMQQVHGGAYDFTRFTLSGHRRIFKFFEELKSGASSGSGTTFAWAYQYLLLGLFGYSARLRYFVKAFARVTGFWLKYFDYVECLNKYKPDGASGTFFIGTKSDKLLSDVELIKYYKRIVS